MFDRQTPALGAHVTGADLRDIAGPLGDEIYASLIEHRHAAPRRERVGVEHALDHQDGRARLRWEPGTIA